ncbi:class I SAM-dependent DNA methyltransferase [Rhizobium laguerreae]|uniref:class I SAM-dependent DNA methyltransferase n=1 Tax=Rhizobium laguerreae TaxID=1076926 RepID=UPI001A8EE7EC|nr:class I SAM-dependent DNA methyltransferase [Rhizobium laguerreae]MBN9981853.1 class I SAM-dependent DNA methyltransferase [Rhizobium laguerreae]
MQPKEFIQKWSNSSLKERAAAQEHFLDLCRLLDEATPAQVDPTGFDYGFEVGATKTTGGKGFADVFKRGFFAWEYKGTKANLDTAFAQLQRYAVALDNPPLLVVSDIGSLIRIHTNWTNSVSKVYEIPISDLGDAEKRGWLKGVFSDPETLRPKKTRQQLTEEVAGDFAKLARSLRERGHAPELVAHFINRLVFCMFAEDVKLLPDGIFTRMLERALEEPAEFEAFARDLFVAMKSGGRVGFERIAWFNGGLFDDDLVISLTKSEIKIVRDAAAQYWGDIDPSILGTLFERGLDPDKRSQLGAHYTDRDKIMMVINPVIVEPLTGEWEAAKSAITALVERASTTKGASRTKAVNQAQSLLDGYLKRLSDFRVLDPACGSGNFLYLALRALKDLEHKAQVEAESLGLPRGFPRIGPEVVKGIEINHYAAELARVSVWIGEIQWMIKNGFSASQNPILKPLNNIECRDALMACVRSDDGAGDWEEAEWPKADAIVGNPPFLGGKRLRTELGPEVVNRLFSIYAGRVPPEADLVVYWLEKGLKERISGRTQRVGFVMTNSVRGGANRKVMERIVEESKIISAWPDEPWTVEGAAVRVSLVVFGALEGGEQARINGNPVEQVNSDLTATSADFTKAQRLPENLGVAYMGDTKGGAFEVPGQVARGWLSLPTNPNGRKNTAVLRPWFNGLDVTRRPRDIWIVDFGWTMTEEEAALFEAPFKYVHDNVYPVRALNNREAYRRFWWRHVEPRQGMWSRLKPLTRCIVTPEVSRYRVFAFLPTSVVPDHKLQVIARDDYCSFGILASRHHELWSLRVGNWHGAGNDPRYTITTCFQTFPFPDGLTPNSDAADYADDSRAIQIAKAAKRLNELRENWLNPPDLVRREAEVAPGYPDRIVPVSEEAEKVLKRRTLTSLYSERPAWLDHAHKALDIAVAAAYGWAADLSDEEILGRLFALNQKRASEC